jgi:general secretion pathway protein M
MMDLNLVKNRFLDLDSRTRLRIGAGIAVLLAVAILISAANDRITRLAKKRSAREAAVAEMLQLKLRYLEANATSQKLANRLAATRPDDSPAKIIEEIGIKGKNTQIKPVKGDELAGFTEDAAEVKMEGLSANEAINLIYRLEMGTRPVTVKKALVRTRFDDPAKIDLALTIALLKNSGRGDR